MAGGVTPRQIYQALISAGASTDEAIGMMANMINESSLNVETGAGGTAIDSNGYPVYGLVSWNTASYPGAASLVTGNPAQDLAAQAKYLAQTGGFKAAAGGSPAAAAGGFAANYERCAGCQPGGSQYQSRVANAATVAGWVTSGKWPTSGGTAQLTAQSSPAQTEAATAAAQQKAGCLVSMPSLDLYVTSIGGGCIVSRSTARGVAGVAILAAGGGIGLLGLILLAAYGLKSSGAGKVAGRALEVGGAVAAVAGAPELGVPLAAAGSQVRRQGASRAATTAATKRGQQQLTARRKAEAAAGKKAASNSPSAPT
jgi:Phage tail lysozyme